MVRHTENESRVPSTGTPWAASGGSMADANRTAGSVAQARSAARRRRWKSAGPKAVNAALAGRSSRPISDEPADAEAVGSGWLACSE